VRGENTFWATRVAGEALALCSAASLVYTVHSYRRRLSDGVARCSAQLPVSRVVASWYTGGLWLWLCLAAQDGAVHPAGTRPWIMVLLVLALLLGLIEGLRWQALARSYAKPQPQVVHGNSFDWGAAGIGAIGVFGLLLCAAVLIGGIRRIRQEKLAV